jgi:hypothetical protein
VSIPVFKTGGRYLRYRRCVRLAHASANLKHLARLPCRVRAAENKPRYLGPCFGHLVCHDVAKDIHCGTDVRVTHETKHKDFCSCWRCFSNAMGCYIDSLTSQTSAGEWQIFATITDRTSDDPRRRGFPTGGSGRPKADFAHHLFDRLIVHLEGEVAG